VSGYTHSLTPPITAEMTYIVSGGALNSTHSLAYGTSAQNRLFSAIVS